MLMRRRRRVSRRRSGPHRPGGGAGLSGAGFGGRGGGQRTGGGGDGVGSQPSPEFSFGGMIVAVGVMLGGVLAIPVMIAVVTAVLQGPR